jgi:hypothetical protein
VLFAPFTPSISRILGTRTSVIISVIFCGTIVNVLFYPVNYLVYVACLLNGVGCALLRVAALTYMTKNSTRQTLSRNNSIHWMMLTLGIILGNLIVMLVNIQTTEIDSDKRYAIATATTVLCLLGIPGYFFTVTIPGNYDEILEAQLREQIHQETTRTPTETTSFTSFPHHGTHSQSIASEYTPIMEGEEEAGVREIIVGMYRVMLRTETFWLLGPMLAAGVYNTAFQPIIPTAIGNVSDKPWIVSAFGILAGLGQLGGAFITGQAIDRVNVRKIAVVITFFAVLSFSLVALIVEMGFSDRWTQWSSFSEGLVLLLAFFIGACDMSNNVCLSVAIGRIFRGDSDPAFSLYITALSFSTITWYVFQTITHSHLYLILILYAVVSIAAAFSYASMKFHSSYDSDYS